MIAGVLVSLILVVLFCPDNGSVHVIRAAALGTIAMGFGGSMTYGQTVVDPRHTAGRKLGFPSLGDAWPRHQRRGVDWVLWIFSRSRLGR